MNNFKFSQSSIDNLKYVDTTLVQVVHLALKLSEVDFAITEGLRTLDRQKRLVSNGKSQTLNSKHLDDKSTPNVIDSWAVDVAAYIGSDISWDIEYYIQIAEAFRQAAIQLNVKMVWGGSWAILNDERSAKISYHHYIQLRRSQNRTPFIDGPHFHRLKE